MPEKEFLDELRLQLTREHDRKTTLENKANSIMAVAGTVASLLFGFGLLFLGNIDPTYPLVYALLITFISAIILIVATLISTTFVHISRKISDPMSHDVFYPNDVFDGKITEKFRNSDDKKFYKRMTEEYLFCIKFNSKSNRIKGVLLSVSQVLFILGMFLLIPLVIFVIHAFSTNKIVSILT